MKTVTLMAAALLTMFTNTYAQLDTSGPRATEPVEAADTKEDAPFNEAGWKLTKDSIHATFKYQTGKVTLDHGVVIQVPPRLPLPRCAAKPSCT